MLEFIILDTYCKISDDYSIECKGGEAEKIKIIWEGILNDSAPNRPCPIDEMHGTMESLGAKIIKYEEEFNPNLVY